ncbi:hypothetical protein FHT00_003281 [Sphingomonas insulae]|nr:hypothetical protein [Sphingomonas insulae]
MPCDADVGETPARLRFDRLQARPDRGGMGIVFCRIPA